MAGGQSDDKPDLWRSVQFLLGYSSELPDMTPADYHDAAALSPLNDVTAVDAGPPPVVRVHTTRIAPPPIISPAAPSKTLGDILSQALGFSGDHGSCEDWEWMEAFSALIARHYCLCPDLVWGAVLDMEAHAYEQTGLPCLRKTFEVPWGASALGLYIAKELGVEGADDLPLIHLAYH